MGQSIYTNVEQKAQALQRNLGCLPPRRLVTKLPLGLDRLYQIYKGFTTDQLPEMFASFVKEGGNTFDMEVLGVRLIGTQDLRNLEAILVSKRDCKTRIPRFVQFTLINLTYSFHYH